MCSCHDGDGDDVCMTTLTTRGRKDCVRVAKEMD